MHCMILALSHHCSGLHDRISKFRVLGNLNLEARRGTLGMSWLSIGYVLPGEPMQSSKNINDHAARGRLTNIQSPASCKLLFVN